MRIFPKKTPFFLLAVLILTAAYFLCRSNESKKLFGNINLMENPERYSISIISDSSMAVTLSYNGEQWLVNNAYEANEERIENLLYLLSHVEWLNPIPQNMQESVTRKLHCKGFLVAINKDDKLQGKAYIMEESSVGLLGAAKDGEVFLLGTGGYEFDILSTLSAEPAFWCANQIFTFPIESLREVCVKHIAMPGESFCIHLDNGSKPVLTTLNDTLPQSYDEILMKRYLTYFGNVFVDKMIAGGAGEQHALKNDLQHVIQITSPTETCTVACIGLKTPEGNYDTDKFLLYHYEKNRWALASWVRFDLLLKNYSHFLKNAESL